MMPTGKFYKQISQILIAFFIINLHVILQVKGFSKGAPGGTCDTMMPTHGVPGQKTSAPYNISVSSKTYSPNQKINVTIEVKSTYYIKGFLMVARKKGDTESFGRFIPTDETHGLQCSNKIDSGITHSTNTKRYSMHFIWEAPATNVGELQIMATIIKSKVTFWLNVMSEVMTPINVMSEVMTTSTNRPLITTTERQTNEMNCNPTSKCQIRWQMDKTAGVTKFDFSLNSGATNMYIALGLSSDRKMGSDSVMECLRYPNGSIRAQTSYNDGTTNILVPSDAITLMSTSFENGVMKCSFIRRNIINNSKIYNLDGTEWYFLVAIGTVNTKKPAQKDIHSTSFSSQIKIDLSKNEGLRNIEEDSKRGTLISVHGCLMIFAWVFFASVGMFSARYSKSISIKLRGLAIWFQLHRISMAFTLLLTITGFILIFAAKGEYSNSYGLPYDAHPILGIIVTFLTLVNPIMAFFRPNKDSPKRPWFNWAHRCVGGIAFILADATIFIGIFWYHHLVSAANSAVAVMIAFIIYKCFAVITMELLDCWKERTACSIEMHASGEKVHSEVKVEHFGKLKNILLIFHIIISCLLSVLLIIFLNVNTEHGEHNHDD